LKSQRTVYTEQAQVDIKQDQEQSQQTLVPPGSSVWDRRFMSKGMAQGLSATLVEQSKDLDWTYGSIHADKLVRGAAAIMYQLPIDDDIRIARSILGLSMDRARFGWPSNLSVGELPSNFPPDNQLQLF